MSLCDVDPAPPAAISSDIPAYVSSPDGHLNGELRTWHKVTIGLRGFLTCEKALPNPFTDYRLDVTFTHIGTGRTHSIPGYYAADGNAANTGASKGDVWLAHFAPGLDGTWNWSASFVRGGGVAQKGGGSSAGYFDGASGSFDILETDKAGRDLRGKGLLEYVGEHHLRFAGSREWFLKAGADSPENMLAYDDFDNTPDIQGLRKAWSAHDQDYYPGNPTWAGGRGRAIIGGKSDVGRKCLWAKVVLPGWRLLQLLTTWLTKE